MGLIPKSQIAFLNAVSDLTFANPFSPKRIELEQTALGREFQAEQHPFGAWLSRTKIGVAKT